MTTKSSNSELIIEEKSVATYRIPTEEPESDGTLKWEHTDLVLVFLKSGKFEGIGYTYANSATAKFILEELFPELNQENPLNIPGIWNKMHKKVRNFGHSGISAMAISAVDNALWDLKAKLLNLPLCKLLGEVREEIAVYASGGFTSYNAEKLQQRFKEWLQKGHHMFKMKIGRDRKEDQQRIKAARKILEDRQLFVDANGAYFPKEAIYMANLLQDFDISWYEEPVTSDDLVGMKFVREQIPAQIKVAAGEYGFTPTYFNRMIISQAVDVLQADATRCGGISGFLKVHTLCEVNKLPLSAHCAPSLHLHLGLSLNKMQHIEYFRDHVRIEKMLFEGFREAENGKMYADLNEPGIGIKFKAASAEKFKIK